MTHSPALRSLASALVLAAGAAVAAHVPAQEPLREPPQEPKPESAALSGHALLQRLRAPELSLDDAAPLVAQLPMHPLTIRLPACDVLRSRFLERLERHGAACAKVQAKVAKAAAAEHKDLLGKRGAEAIDAARQQALAISRDAGLSKERIHDELDPLVAQLEARSWPSREQLLARVPDVDAELATLGAERDELARARGLYTEATAGLEEHPGAVKHFTKVPPPPPAPAAADLADEWVVWTLLGLPLSPRDRKALEANEVLRAVTDPEEMAGTTALNRLRFLLGLSLLRLDDRLGAAARDHSLDMVTLGFFAHESPVAGKKTPWERAARFGTSGSAENIAWGQRTGQDAIRCWWYSPGHHRNMLGGHARTGLGRHQQHWTQMFGS